MSTPPSNSNPSLLHKGDSTRTPLFLIHDASGSINAYSKLPPLNRPVYTISNPRLQENINGVEGLAREYASLIKTVVAKGDVLLGGFSYGGILALATSRHINNTPHTPRSRSRSRLRAIGLVLLNTPFPDFGTSADYASVPIDLVLRNYPAHGREQALRCMKRSALDVRPWARRNGKARALPGATSNGHITATVEDFEAEEPPPAVLVLARDYVPVKEERSVGHNGKRKKVAMVDHLRGERGGWERFVHGGSFVSAVWEVPGHHFGLFEQSIVAEISQKLSKACELLAED